MSEFENWFKTTEAYKMLEEQNYFKMDLFFFVEARNQYRHSGVQVAYLTWQHQQAKIEKLENELSTTKQVLGNVIDMEVAKVDNLKAQLNNMEACYVEKKKQVEECAALAAGWNEIAWDKTTHWTEGYEEGCYHCSAQIEEALRGAND